MLSNKYRKQPLYDQQANDCAQEVFWVKAAQQPLEKPANKWREIY